MAEIIVAAERPIGGPPEDVYGYLRDYREHHPRILPPAFSEFTIEQGGIGAGTIFSVRITTARRTRVYRMQVAEPQPGRVLTESDTNSSLVTTFTVLPVGTHSRVRIETRWQGAKGIGGFFERLFAPRAAGRLYADELARLDRYARERTVARERTTGGNGAPVVDGSDKPDKEDV